MALLEVNWQPSDRELRGFAFVQLFVAGVIGWLLHRRLGWDAVAIALMAFSIGVLVAGLVRPQVLKVPFLAWMLAAFPVGWMMSHLLLGVVYYGVVTPIGVFLRMRGRDSLQLQPRSDVKSYWVARPGQPDSSRYFRQF